jgi:hypothetical protein
MQEDGGKPEDVRMRNKIKQTNNTKEQRMLQKKRKEKYIFILYKIKETCAGFVVESRVHPTALSASRPNRFVAQRKVFSR